MAENPSDGPEPIPDAGPCQTLGATCTGDFLRTCTTLGEMPTQRTCGWGCDDTGADARCKVITPSADAVSESDLDPATFGALTPITLANVTFDSDAGTITNTTSNFTAQASANGNAMVFRFAALTLSGPIRMVGGRAIAIVADGKITITADINALGCGGPDVRTPGPGGFAGGANNGDGAGPSAGKQSAGSGTCGAGGGGHAGAGGAGGLGGDASKCVAGQQGVGGTADSDATITMLIGGSGGAGGDGGGGGFGGGGGAAIQLVSNTSIEITASGSINAGGCGGEGSGGGGSDSAGGGGAGGTILVEAPLISIAGALGVNGGGGGGGRGGAVGGEPGSASRVAAAGGPKGGSGGAGGNGAAAATYDGTAGSDGDRAGGGGGAVGRMRFLVRPGLTPTLDNLKLSPATTDTSSPTSTGEATVH